MSTTEATAPTTESALFALQLLARLANGDMAIGAVGSPDTTPLPPHIAQLFHEVLAKLAAGHAVAVTEQRTELTPNEAAEFLNVSRPYVIKLLDEGVLPVRMVGTHRRIPYADLVTYKHAQKARSRAAMNDVYRLSQEMGLYDAAPPMPLKSDYRIDTDRSE